jgi:hypothetical protein
MLKVGKTTNPKRRARDARTWLPDVDIIAFKPFWEIGRLERTMHAGLANLWHRGEWHSVDEIDCQFLVDGFREFYDDDRDMNSVDFIYWFNGSGLAEVAVEGNSRRLSLREWQREAREERCYALADPQARIGRGVTS